ncbi:MAG TPA: guanylate kinase [Clostridia bacterium]|nr:guanylate kinase [Clostridia bacterium]
MGDLYGDKKGLLVVISGPSGTGKGTVCQEYLNRHPETLMSVSMTTRQPRKGEEDRVDYFFTDKTTFEEMIEEGGFLEYAKVYDNYYGTPKSFVKENLLNGRDIILEIDIQGALQIKEKFDEGVFIFIVPPTMEELKRRIKGRGTETTESLLKRFSGAYKELNFITRYNYIVINDKIEDAASKIQSIILAEKCRVDRNKGFYTKLQGGMNDDLSDFG